MDDDEWIDMFWQILTVETVAAPDGRRRTHFEHCWATVEEGKAETPVGSLCPDSSMLLLQLLGLEPNIHRIMSFIKQRRSVEMKNPRVSREMLKEFIRSELSANPGIVKELWERLRTEYGPKGSFVDQGEQNDNGLFYLY